MNSRDIYAIICIGKAYMSKSCRKLKRDRFTMYKLMIPFAVIMFGLFVACSSSDGSGESSTKGEDTQKALSLVNKNPATPLPVQEHTGRVTSL